MRDREGLQRQMDALRDLISRDWRILDDPQLTQEERTEIVQHAKSCAEELIELTRRLHNG
jgi:hypothetical protein